VKTLHLSKIKLLGLGTLLGIGCMGFSSFASTETPQQAAPSSGWVPTEPSQKNEPEAKLENKHNDTAASAAPAGNSSDEDKAACLETMKSTVRSENLERLKAFCSRLNRLQGCASGEGRPIFHSDSGSPDSRGKRILVLGMIHGDEPLSGEMALEWESRLQKIGHRNSWRVIPLLNPDGLKRKTRMNANGVDLNRNFPTKDWEHEALTFWKKTSKEDPRRFPGNSAASEAETKCVMNHIKEFKPDFVVSVHTPYKVLDFDGPHMHFPHYRDLPWRALGNFPGSLGRMMWKDYQIPVLTVELGTTMVDAAHLQDIVGSFAIEASRLSGQKTARISGNSSDNNSEKASEKVSGKISDTRSDELR
jgi:murein peptide amidase A